MNEQARSTQTPAAIARAYGKVAKDLQGLGEFGLAMKALERGLAKAPEAAAIHISQGELLVNLFNHDQKTRYLKKALGCFAQAIEFDPQNYLARLLSAQIYLKGRSLAKARTMLEAILENAPGDERATALLKVVEEKEAALKPPPPPPEPEPTVEEAAAPVEAAPVADEAPSEAPTPVAAAEPVDDDTGTVDGLDDEEEDEGELVIADGISDEEAERVAVDPNASGMWTLEEKVVISTGETDDEEELMHGMLSSKLTIFSRLEGLSAIFLLDKNGQPFKTLNRAKLDENVIPSLVFNLFKASVNGMRRAGLGSFQRGTLTCPIGVVVVANAFYATLAVVVDADANQSVVEARIQRYLSEVTG